MQALHKNTLTATIESEQGRKRRSPKTIYPTPYISAQALNTVGNIENVAQINECKTANKVHMCSWLGQLSLKVVIAL